MRDLAGRGYAILFYSTDLAELANVTDRTLVLATGGSRPCSPAPRSARIDPARNHGRTGMSATRPRQGCARRAPGLAPLLVLIVIASAIEVLRPGSFTIDQLSLKCAAALTLIFVATGETIVVLRGGIDLAVGGIVSLATAIAATSAGEASGPDGASPHCSPGWC